MASVFIIIGRQYVCKLCGIVLEDHIVESHTCREDPCLDILCIFRGDDGNFEVLLDDTKNSFDYILG